MSAFIRVAAVVAIAAAIVSVPVIVNRPQGPAAVAPPPLSPTTCPAGTVLKSGDIATIIGTGQTGPMAAGIQAISANASPIAIAVDPSGTVYLATSSSSDIWRVGVDGVLQRVLDATTVPGLTRPRGLALDAAGNLYIAALEAGRIWRLDPNAGISVVAGTGVRGSSGNDGSALTATIQPGTVAVGPKGDLYFDDVNNFRKVDPQGAIHAFAGTATAGFGGDGGAAISATLGDSVAGVAAGPDGSVYLGDGANHRVRKVDPAGIISTLAGDGSAGYSGDGSAAVQAQLNDPLGLAVDTAGNVYVADDATHTVRKIDPSGTITTVAGTGVAGFSGDCGPAAAAQLNGPTAVAVADGVLYIVDGGNGRIRMVVP